MKNLSTFLAWLAITLAAFTACGKNDSSDKNDNPEDKTVAVTGVMLDRATATLHLTGQPLTLVATVTPDSATNKTVSWASSNTTVATVAGGVVTPVAAGTATITATTQDGGMTATCAVTVDAPLTTDATGVVIGGTKWARCNVDAPHTFAATPQDFGMFYQWNSAIGWSATDPLVSTPAGATFNLTWDGNGATTWENANDPCPAGWRVPTNAELTALAATDGGWTTTPAPGRTFGSGTIFLPAAGFRSDFDGRHTNLTYGTYWSCTSTDDGHGYMLSFYSGEHYLTSNNFAPGLNVRCVAD